MGKRDFTSARAKENILPDREEEPNVDNIKVREMVNVAELEISNLEQDPNTMELERCCGNCCWFYAEDTDGYGLCPLALMETKRCDEPCTEGKYVSREDMRHHMAVLLQANRYRRDDHVPAIHRMPDPKELGRAIDFAVEYMRVFKEL